VSRGCGEVVLLPLTLVLGVGTIEVGSRRTAAVGSDSSTQKISSSSNSSKKSSSSEAILGSMSDS
jgi:hypothetical protein